MHEKIERFWLYLQPLGYRERMPLAVVVLRVCYRTKQSLRLGDWSTGHGRMQPPAASKIVSLFPEAKR